MTLSFGRDNEIMEFLVVARARVGWGKGNTSFSCGAFCKAKYKFRRRPKRGRGGRGGGGGGRSVKFRSPDFRQKKFGFRPTNTTKHQTPLLKAGFGVWWTDGDSNSL